MHQRKSRIAAFVALLAALGMLLAGPASATDPGDAPPGYGGPVSTCPGTLIYVLTMYDQYGHDVGSRLHIWYSTGSGGTYCAKTYDNLSDSHHIEVVVRRGDWQTNWYDSGTYTTYAGGIEVFGAATKCVYFFGRVTANGLNYEARLKTSPCP